MKIMKNMKKQGKKHFSGKGLSIKQKVTLWYACMLVLIVLLLFGFIFSISRSLLQRESDSRLEEVVLDFVDDIDFENGSYELDDDIRFYEDGVIYKSTGGKAEKIIETSRLQILGLHNYENVMAAAAMADSFGVPMEVIRKVLEQFRAVEHRIEYVVEKRGVKFYNDSKGTNPDAAIQGIRAMERPTFLIGGGYDKQSEYDEWIEAFDGKVKQLVLIGQTREKIADCAKKHGFTEIAFADSLEEAMDICYQNAVEGDAILLSPACASWGMFDNYEQRGEKFKEYARNLKE